MVFPLQTLLQKVIDFQAEARQALNDDVPESEKVERLMEIGVTLDVDLPEIPRLRDVSFWQLCLSLS